MKPLDEINLSASYLLLISPENIPHLAIVNKGEYYSLTHKKAFIAEPFQPYFNFLKRSNKKMIFLELNEQLNELTHLFSKYKKADLNSVTCLMPVKDTVLPNSKANFIYELIPELYSKNKIKQAFYVNFEGDLNKLLDFNLSVYPKEAIYAYIESLNKKYAKRH